MRRQGGRRIGHFPSMHIIADSSDNDIRLTRLPDKKTIGHIRSVANFKAIAFTSERNLLLFEVSDYDRKYIVREKTIQDKTIQEKSLPIIYNQNIECTAAAFSMNGQWLAVGFTDGTIRIFDVQKNREIQTLPSSYGKIKSLAVPSDGRLLTVVFEKNITHKAILYNLQTAQETEKFFNATVAAFSPDGKLLALAVTLELWTSYNYLRFSREEWSGR